MNIEILSTAEDDLVDGHSFMGLPSSARMFPGKLTYALSRKQSFHSLNCFYLNWLRKI
jgi:hypothetical protein